MWPPLGATTAQSNSPVAVNVPELAQVGLEFRLGQLNGENLVDSNRTLAGPREIIAATELA